jgi:hypothetical protein
MRAEINVASLRNPQTKAEAVAFVSAVLRSSFALLSPDFQLAMDLSERFDVRARDLLEYRKMLAKNS